MQIVILAAGRGVRMGDLTVETPKPMLEIQGKPILAHKIEALPEGVDEVIIVVGYLRDQIQRYFKDEYAGRKIRYVIQEKLEGTGGAIHLAKEILRDDFLVMMGDDLYMKGDIEKMTKHDLALLGFEIMNPKSFGVISLDEKGNLRETRENKNIEGIALVNTGLYKLNRKFFDYPLVKLDGKEEFGLPQGLALMAEVHTVHVERASSWFPIGNPEDLEKAQTLIEKFI
jgi:NDP-sugar pyrophosphorylase family protein